MGLFETIFPARAKQEKSEAEITALAKQKAIFEIQKAQQEQQLLGKTLGLPSQGEEIDIARKYLNAQENPVAPQPATGGLPAYEGTTQAPFVGQREKSGFTEPQLNMTTGQFKDVADAQFKLGLGRQTGKQPLTTQGAIESKYASREFVKSVVPELREDEDISVGELQQRLGIKKADTAANNPKPVSGEQVDKITGMRNAIGGAQKIKDQFFTLLGKGKNIVDPIEGRWEAFKGGVGIQDDAEITKFQTDVMGQLITYLNQISGAAITPQEAERLKTRLPGVGMSQDQFLGRLDSFESELKDSLSNRVLTLRDAGYKIGDLDKLIVLPKAKSTDKVGFWLKENGLPDTPANRDHAIKTGRVK